MGWCGGGTGGQGRVDSATISAGLIGEDVLGTMGRKQPSRLVMRVAPASVEVTLANDSRFIIGQTHHYCPRSCLDLCSPCASTVSGVDSL